MGPTVFLAFQIKSESFLEDINNILNSGDVPNLYGGDEQERILTAMKPVVQDLGLQPTKANLMAAYVKRVRSNIHTVLCMRLDTNTHTHNKVSETSGFLLKSNSSFLCQK